jgi:hypothetical protein
LYLLCFTACLALACTSSSTTLPARSTQQEWAAQTQRKLAGYLGRPVKDAVSELGLSPTEPRHWVTEPPFSLAGMEFYTKKPFCVTLYLDPKDPLYMAPPIGDYEWDYDAFLRATVGGIREESENGKVEVGIVLYPTPSAPKQK